MVPGVGIEPTSAFTDNILSVARIPIPPPGQGHKKFRHFVEATARIELAHRDFADPRITTFLRGLCVYIRALL